MEHIGRFHSTPDDVVRAAVARQQADTRTVLRVPGVGHGHACTRGVDGEGYRQIQDQHIAGGDGAIVDHRPIRHGDLDLLAHPRIRSDHNIAHKLAVAAIVADRMQFAGGGIEVRVGGEPAELQAAI